MAEPPRREDGRFDKIPKRHWAVHSPVGRIPQEIPRIGQLGPGLAAETARVEKYVPPSYRFSIPRLIAWHGWITQPVLEKYDLISAGTVSGVIHWVRLNLGIITA